MATQRPEISLLGRSPSAQALFSLGRSNPQGLRSSSAPSSPRPAPTLRGAARAFVEQDSTNLGRVVRSERLLQRAIKSPELVGVGATRSRLQQAIQTHLIEYLPHFDEALLLARQALTPVPLLVRPTVWHQWADVEVRSQLAELGHPPRPDLQDGLIGRLRSFVAGLPGSQAGAMLLWQRFDAQELLILLGRPQRAWFTQTSRYVRREGMCRTALELRLFYEGEALGCPGLTHVAREPLTGMQRQQLRWLAPSACVNDILDLAYPGPTTPRGRARERLLVHIEHWLYELAAAVPLPQASAEGDQAGSSSAGQLGPVSVNFAAQHRYFESLHHRELERRLIACEEELARQWVPILKEGMRSLVASRLAEVTKRWPSPEPPTED